MEHAGVNDMLSCHLLNDFHIKAVMCSIIMYIHTRWLIQTELVSVSRNYYWISQWPPINNHHPDSQEYWIIFQTRYSVPYYFAQSVNRPIYNRLFKLLIIMMNSGSRIWRINFTMEVMMDNLGECKSLSKMVTFASVNSSVVLYWYREVFKL
jgi:hypothetical protein